VRLILEGLHIVALIRRLLALFRIYQHSLALISLRLANCRDSCRTFVPILELTLCAKTRDSAREYAPERARENDAAFAVAESEGEETDELPDEGIELPDEGIEQTDKITSDCIDSNETCARWAERGECALNPSYMLMSCPASCAICQSMACHDTHGDCAQWAARGGCASNSAYMLKSCSFSCYKHDNLTRPCVPKSSRQLSVAQKENATTFIIPARFATGSSPRYEQNDSRSYGTFRMNDTFSWLASSTGKTSQSYGTKHATRQPAMTNIETILTIIALSSSGCLSVCAILWAVCKPGKHNRSGRRQGPDDVAPPQHPPRKRDKAHMSDASDCEIAPPISRSARLEGQRRAATIIEQD